MQTNNNMVIRIEQNNNNATKTKKKKKKNWLKSLIKKAEQDRTANDLRYFYRTTRFFRTEYKPKAYGIEDKDGTILI